MAFSIFRKKGVLVLLLLLVCIVVVLLLFSKSRAKKAASAPANVATTSVSQALYFLKSDITQVGFSKLSTTLPISGAIAAKEQMTVKSYQSGELLKLHVRKGDTVKAGTLLAEIDNSELKNRLEQARSQVAVAEKNVAIARQDSDNKAAMFAQNFISKNDFTNSQNQLEIANANLKSAHAALNLATIALEQATIRAPMAGVVSERWIEEGERVYPDVRILKIVNLRQAEFQASVTVEDILNVKVGQSALIYLDGLNQPIPGKVARINPSAQSASRTIPVYLDLNPPANVTLRDGMFAEGKIILNNLSKALTIPESALRRNSGGSFVYAIFNGKVEERSVQEGLRGEADGKGVVQIVKGLNAGDTIVALNLGGLTPGTSVKIGE